MRRLGPQTPHVGFEVLTATRITFPKPQIADVEFVMHNIGVANGSLGAGAIDDMGFPSLAVKAEERHPAVIQPGGARSRQGVGQVAFDPSGIARSQTGVSHVPM